MSNEELVAVIQAGATERMGELWEQVEGLVKWKANHIMSALDLRGNSCGVEFEDLYHSGYPALVKAVETYDPDAGGAFSTWLVYYLRNAFAVTAGYRTKTGQNEPLNNALSLDTPLTDDSDSDTMMEVIADPDGQKPTQSVEEAIFHSQLCEVLETALDAIPEQYGDVLRLRYYEGQTLAEIAAAQGTTPERVRQKENKGLRELRRPRYACHLRPFYDFDFYCGTGLEAFKATGMSAQERYLMIEEERRERAARQQKEREAQDRQRREQARRKMEESFAHCDQMIQEYLQSLSPEARADFERRLAAMRGT